MEDINDYSKFPKRYYNIAGKSILSNEFDQNFDNPPTALNKSAQKFAKPEEDFHKKAISTTVAQTKRAPSPKRDPMDLGTEVYDALKQRYLEKYGTTFEAKPESDTLSMSKRNINKSRSISGKSKHEMSKTDDLIELWKLKYKPAELKEKSKEIKDEKEKSMTFKNGENIKEIDKKLLNAAKQDIEYTVNKYYSIEIENKKKAMEMDNTERKKMVEAKKEQRTKKCIEDVVDMYYKCKEEEIKAQEAKSKEANESISCAKDNGKKQEKAKAEDKSSALSHLAMTEIKSDLSLMKAALYKYYSVKKEYAADSSKVLVWCDSLGSSELDQLCTKANAKISMEIFKSKLSTYYSHPESYVRFVKYCKLKNIADSLIQGPDVVLKRYNAIEKNDKCLWAICGNEFDKYITKTITERRDKEKKEKEERAAKEEQRRKKMNEALHQKVFGEKKEIKTHDINEMAKPAVDKYGVGKALLEWKKRFPFDNIVDKLLKKEFADNRVFRYPEEYEIYNEEEEKLRKLQKNKKMITSTVESNSKQANDRIKAWVEKDKAQLEGEKKAKQEIRGKINDVFNFVKEKALEYLNKRDNRIFEEVGTLKSYIISCYQEIITKVPYSKEMFPFHLYGLKKGSNTAKTAYPKAYKQYFIDILRGFVKTPNGYVQIRQKRRKALWIPSNSMNPNDKNKPISETVDQSKNVKTIKDTHEKELHEIVRTKGWMRGDTYEIKKKFLMCNSEIENCQFQPHCGRYIEKKRCYANQFGNEKLNPDREENPDNWVKSLGTNFKDGHPEIFKKSKLNKATKLFNEAQYDDCLKYLKEGFKMDSLYRKFDANFEKAISKIVKTEKKICDNLGIPSLDDTTQKSMPEEDFENKKVLPIYREAYDLFVKLYKVRTKLAFEQKQKKEEIMKKLTSNAKKEISDEIAANFDTFFEKYSISIWGNCAIHKCKAHEELWNEEHVMKCDLLKKYENALKDWKAYYTHLEQIKIAKAKYKYDKAKVIEIIKIIQTNKILNSKKKKDESAKENSKKEENKKDENKKVKQVEAPRPICNQPEEASRPICNRPKVENPKKEEPKKGNIHDEMLKQVEAAKQGEAVKRTDQLVYPPIPTPIITARNKL